MKSIKVIFGMLIIFFLSGCTAKYNLTIMENNSIVEDIDIMEEIKVINTFSSVSYFLNSEYNLIKKDGTYKDYDIEIYTNDEFGVGSGRKEYKNFDNYKKNSIIVNDMFKDIMIKKENDIISIDMIPKDSFKYFEESEMYSSILDKVEIRLNIPYKVINGNYDKVEGNSYVWEISKNTQLKEIKINYQYEPILFNEAKPAIIFLAIILSIIISIAVYTYINYKKSLRY